MALAAGFRLGSHEIIGLIGAGGMGEVYLALDTKLSRRVAIKVLPEAYASDADRIARFHREAQAVAALNHTGIAAIYELAEADAIRFLVLELVEGDTLADRIGRGPVPVEEALQIGKQILEALEAAHEKGICHRDLKPANVKLTADGTVKVLDFGLAKFLDTGRTAPSLTNSPTMSLATIPGVIMGTAGYMSPEQAKGFEADQRSDIFAFGSVFYELLTGRRAFEGDTVSEVLASVLKSDVDLSLLPGNLNPRLVETLNRCLEKNPKKRWHAAADVRVELESLVGPTVVTDEPRVIEVPRRPTWMWASAIAAAAALGGLVAGYGAWQMKPEPERAVTRFTVTLAEGERFTSGGRQLVALSPDGKNLVYIADQRLNLRPLDGLESRVIAGSELGGVIVNPVFSPDGKEIAFWSQVDGKIKRLAIAGGRAMTICENPNPLGMHWSEQGIVIGSAGRGILRCLPNGGTPEMIASVGQAESAVSPQMLPGGRAVLFTVRSGQASWDDARIVVQRLDGDRTILIEGGADGRYLPTGHLVYALDGILQAVRFDPETLVVSGAPVPVVEGIRRANGNPASAVAQYTFSLTGSLVYIPGPVTGVIAQGGSDLAIFGRWGGVEALGLEKGQYQFPRVTRDGKRVVYQRADEKETHIWIYELGGGHAPQQLTLQGNNRFPVWSNDGEWIAFTSDREGDEAIFRQRADRSEEAIRLTKPEVGDAHRPLSWSPDGAYLLVKSRSGIDVLSLKDGQIATGEYSPALEGVFSPDGEWIVYTAPNTGGGVVSYVQRFPKTGPPYKVPGRGTAGSGGHAFWSWKGDEIIMNVAAGTSNVVSVTTSPTVLFGDAQDFPRSGRSENNPATTRRSVDILPDESVVGVLDRAALQATQAEEPAAPPPMIVVLNWFDEVRQRVGEN